MLHFFTGVYREVKKYIFFILVFIVSVIVYISICIVELDSDDLIQIVIC